MIADIISTIANWIMSIISSLGYSGVVLLMAIESANIPLPSEIIMPFAGYLVSVGIFNLWLVSFFGALGCVIGGAFSYWLGMVGGRPLIERYGKYILISHHDLDIADRWFKKHGEITAFAGRLLPIIRTFISFPAGIARMNFKKFIVYSFLGSFPFCFLLAYIGQKLGDNREILSIYFHKFDLIIGIIILGGIIWYICRHIKNLKTRSSKLKNKDSN